MKNLEKIKKMNKKELAKFLGDITDCAECPCSDVCKAHVDCSDLFEEWLSEDAKVTLFGDLKIGQKFEFVRRYECAECIKIKPLLVEEVGKKSIVYNCMNVNSYHLLSADWDDEVEIVKEN